MVCPVAYGPPLDTLGVGDAAPTVTVTELVSLVHAKLYAYTTYFPDSDTSIFVLTGF